MRQLLKRNAPRVVLINPPGDLVLQERIEPPLGLMNIASYLQNHLCIRPTILDFAGCSLEEAHDRIAECQADIFGFSIFSTKWHIAKYLISKANNDFPKCTVVVGGPHPTAMPRETLACDNVNVIITGEGEKAFYDVVKKYIDSGPDSLDSAVIDGTRLEENEFPELDFSLVEPPEAYGRRLFDSPAVTLESSRGCQYSCFFCNSIIMGGSTPGGVIPKSPSVVLREIEGRMRSGYTNFRFNDDSFTQAARRTGFLGMLSGLGLKCRIFANIGHMTKEVVRDLSLSGCCHISVGIESYDPRNLAIIGKHTQEDICIGIRRVHDSGILVRAYFIVGLPYDSLESIDDYMTKAAIEVNFDEYAIYPLIPYPGTALWHTPEKFGYVITDRDFTKYAQMNKRRNGSTVLQHERFGPDDVAAWIRKTNEIFIQNGKIPAIESGVK